MSTNILKKLVERFAPETVKEQVAKIDDAAKFERQARAERAHLERDLLENLKFNHHAPRMVTAS